MNACVDGDAAVRGMFPLTWSGLGQDGSVAAESAMEEMKARRPRRIILVRHGESEGNVDESKYTSTADYKIRLTGGGFEQAVACGREIRQIIEHKPGSGSDDDWQVYFYVSPYKRTLCTLRGIGRAFEESRIVGAREEPRIREQDFGNFQCMEVMKVVKGMREKFGRFFYRFPEGESAADVFDRVTSFLESVWRDIDMNRLNRSPKSGDLNLIIVSHGLTMRVFLMRWFKWTVEQFELLNNPQNCEIRVMQLGSGGEYSLAVHHSREELERWGLSPEMIADQEWRATAVRGQWNEEWPWNGRAFFDHFGQDRDVQQDDKRSDFDEDSSTCSDKDTVQKQEELLHMLENGEELLPMPPI